LESNTIIAALSRAARNFPERTFLAGKTDDGWRTLGFRETRVRARNFAGWLLQHGVKKGDRVALFAEGRPEWVICELGALSAGAISVPLSANLSTEEVLVPINHAEASVVAVSRDTAEKICSAAGNINYPLTLVYLDDDISFFDEVLKKYGLPKNRGIHFDDCLILGSQNLPAGELDKIENSASEDEVVTISYTSGTSDLPKGVMLTHQNFVSNCGDALEVFPVPDIKYSTLLLLPCNHSFTHTVGIYLALFRGISLYFMPLREGGPEPSIFNALSDTNPVFLLTLPALSGFFMRKILRDAAARGAVGKALFDAGIRAGVRYHGDGFNRPPFPVRFKNFFLYRFAEGLLFSRLRKTFGSKFRYFIGGGALLDIKQQEFFMALGIPIFQGYGLTESSPVISANTPKVHKLGTSGRVLPGTTCKIIKSNGHPAGIGEVGEIRVQGKNVMKGYYKDDEATRLAIRDEWLHTGDLGYIDEDGFLVVNGRETAVLFGADGDRFSPEEIEEAILSSAPAVRQIMLWNDRRKYTSALIVASENGLLQIQKETETGEPEEVLKALADSIFSCRRDPYYAKRFSPSRFPLTFRLIDTPFTEKNRMLGSTLKLARHRIREVYKDDIEYLYTDAGRSPLNAENLGTLQKMLRNKDR
jgi:long-chain acyl-CoA synthetase